jgi:hypothetical protein
LIDPDSGQAARRDPQRERSLVIVTAPDRQGPGGMDFLD